MILITLIYVNSSLRMKTVMLSIVKFQLLFGLHSNLMLNCKHEDLPKLLFTVGKNCLITFLDDLQNNGIIKRISSLFHEEPNYGTTSLNPLTILKKVILLKLCQMLDISAQTQINHLNHGH